MTNFIEPHKKEWKTEFDNLRRVLLKILDGYDVDIQHVGSTAISGLHAKPILDIDIIIENKHRLGEIAIELEKVGYQNRGEQGISGRFAFRQTSTLTPKTDHAKKWQKHHLYVCFADSLALKNHLLFRDALLLDEKLVEQYSLLKIRLTKENGMTRDKYTERKTDFIVSVLESLGLDKKELHKITSENCTDRL
ncbi:GrpB family protein [Spirosoma montaniterrae]|uniref:GrpB family protein n=1 Tax=Spirosoma montaniterrae TaxID=1178516 RepID=A0A1P9WX09_9BACT|nr:GrpB family protein [Spirosoma montaniterrae]AQG79899.1 hypothetical protein AWR27_11530 [Spirosoma montaniterrae]